MRPTSPLCLLFFLSLTTAIPIPAQLPTGEGANPPSEIVTTITLTSAARTLQSSYLLSLSNPALKNAPQSELQSTSIRTPANPAKPTSALPQLRLEDARRYWATLPSLSIEWKKKEKGPISAGSRGCDNHPRACLGAARLMVRAREQSDLLVLGIVFLFLAAVVVMEAVEYYGDVRSRTPLSRGEIYLENDKKASDAKARSYLSAASPSSHSPSLATVRESSEKSEKEKYHD